MSMTNKRNSLTRHYLSTSNHFRGRVTEAVIDVAITAYLIERSVEFRDSKEGNRRRPAKPTLTTTDARRMAYCRYPTDGRRRSLQWEQRKESLVFLK